VCDDVDWSDYSAKMNWIQEQFWTTQARWTPLLERGLISFDDICLGMALALSQLLAGSGIQPITRTSIVENIGLGLHFAGEPDFDEAMTLLRRLTERAGEREPDRE
jgi:hypothetical protein